MKPRILVVDDDKSVRLVLRNLLQDAGYEVTVSENFAAAQQTLNALTVDLIITDLVLPDGDGIGLLKFTKERYPMVPVIVITGFATIESAVAALKAGAFDYVVKPFENEHLKGLVKNALQLQKLTKENIRLRQEIKKDAGLEAIVGKSPAVMKVRHLVRLAAESDAPVLLLGETGTGKELVARTIHFLGRRAPGPFVPVNCGAIPESLVESELFGHKKGAFTGATSDYQGKFVQADAGTLFLDEVAEMPRELQVKLLRAVDTQEIQPIGASESVRVDVRILSATNQNLIALVKQGTFREDLYYRLAVFTIYIPPLREHPEDIPELVVNYLQRRGKDPTLVTADALKLLQEHDFPGNVRELENVIEFGLILSQGKQIKPEHIAERLMPSRVDELQLPDIPDDGMSLAEIERNYLVAVLKKTKGNRTRAAKLLGISRATLLYRMKKYGLE